MDSRIMNFVKDVDQMQRNIGMILLAAYLIWVGVLGIFSPDVGRLIIIGPILALAAGILILVKR